MLEERNEIENKDIQDDGKIHFPIMGFVVTGVLLVLMIVCIIVILATRK